MPLTIAPITPSFAAEVGDVDLSESLSDERLNEIKEAFWQYSVLVFPNQELSEEDHLRFAGYFGPHETTIAKNRPGHQLRVSKHIADVSNITAEDAIWAEQSPRRLHELANRLWHTDSSYKPLPALASFLYARSIPPVGGHTEFCDERAAYDALPEQIRDQLTGLIAEHCIRFSRARIGFSDFTPEEVAALPAVPQALVRTIPQNGRRTLYLASHIGAIRGMAETAAKELVDGLIEHTTQRQFVYTHRYRVNDLVMWDDRCTMHRGMSFDDLRWRRDVQRATVSDIAPTCEQEGLI